MENLAEILEEELPEQQGPLVKRLARLHSHLAGYPFYL